MRITRFLIRRRGDAADAWLHQLTRDRDHWVRSAKERRARRRLTFWDAILDAWTSNGTRRV